MVIDVPRATTPQPTAPAAPRPLQTKSVQLPTNFQIPPGMVLIRSDSGQLMLVSQQALAQAQAHQGKILRTSRDLASRARPPISQVIGKVPMAQTSLPGTRLVIQPSLVTTTANASAQNAPHTTTLTRVSQETLENVKKCKNFLVTLIKLASSGTQSADMAKNVRELVRQLLDGSLEPEAFTDQLYKELKSTPQPYLVPFLKKSLPAVRQLTPNPQLFIQQVDQPKPQEPTQQTSTQQNSTQQASLRVPTLLSANIKPTPLNTGQATKPTVLVMQPARGIAGKPFYMSTQNRTLTKLTVLPSGQYHNSTGGSVFKRPAISASTATKHSFSNISSSYSREDDDINDVTSMAGVNLREESARILTGSQAMVGSTERSCTDEPFLPPGPLLACILLTGQAVGVSEVGPDVVSLLSHAVQERLRGLLEKATVVAQQRLTAHKEDPWHMHVSDVRSQLRFLEQLEQLEKQRRDEEERERLLRIAKSRANAEDPDQQLLKQRAKELQQLEQTRLQHQQANLAALAALGPRKKRLLDSAGSQVNGAGAAVSGRQRSGFQRVTPTRVTLRDLLLCVEQEPALRHSLILYKALLR
ncbi:transcription initiation factor TFIID subunit 4-like [Aplochiton taeniatus]